jgi:hypothetical protein
LLCAYFSLRDFFSAKKRFRADYGVVPLACGFAVLSLLKWKKLALLEMLVPATMGLNIPEPEGLFSKITDCCDSLVIIMCDGGYICEVYI